MLVYLKYHDCFAQVVRLVLICRWSTCYLGYWGDIRTGVASNWGHDSLYSQHACDDDLCSTSRACRLRFARCLVPSSTCCHITEQFPGSTSCHVVSRTTPYDFTLQCFYLSCWILWFSLFFQNCEWETIASLALLNTAQNSVITAGLLAGTLYCGKLVVDGSLGVSTGNKIPAMCQGSKKQ